MILLRWESVKKFKNLIKPIQIWRRKPWKIRWISIKSLEKPNQIKLTDWLANRPIDRATDQPNDRATNRATDWPTHQPTDRSSDWVTQQATKQPSNRPIDWATEQLSNQSSDRVTDGPTDGLTDWLMNLMTICTKKTPKRVIWKECGMKLI